MATYATTAALAAKAMTFTAAGKIDVFNQMVKYHTLSSEPFELRLTFQKFGSGLVDIQFAIDAGYVVKKDVENNCWIITIPVKKDALDGYEKPVLDLNVLPASKAAQLLPSASDRRLALFNSYVAQELTKLDPFPFRVYLTFSMFGDQESDVQFVRDNGYVVTKNVPNETWDISLPEV